MPQRSDHPTSAGRNVNTRLMMIAAAIGAAVVLVISAVLNWPVEDSAPSRPDHSEAEAAPPAVFRAEAGTCLDWTGPDAGDIHRVSCQQPHLFEVTGKAELGAEFGPDAPYPSTEQWQQIKQERCTQVSERFLSGSFDPYGRFRVGAFTPSEAGWEAGNRTLHCGLQQPGATGALYRIKDSVTELDQSAVFPAGTCLGISGTNVTDPVDCAEPHSVEITGLVDLSEKFPDGYPEVPAQDNFLATRCGELTAQYAGSPTAAKDKGLIVYWDSLKRESWDAGSRKVNCKVGAQLPDGSGLAPVTGSVQGEVRVGEEPAPERTPSLRPGAPAEGNR